MSKTNCSIRLQELNDAAKPAPTRLEGSQVALGNVIRRRVASIRKKTNSDNSQNSSNILTSSFITERILAKCL